MPPLKDGQVLVRNLAFSFDPTQRGWMSMDTYMPAIPIGQTMKAATVGQVVESKRTGFAKGDLVQGLFGWEDYTVSGGEGMMGLQKLPRGTDPILALSLLGTTGLTAYFGTLAVGAAKAGDTFVVSGAAGATGSVAGMIAKIKGCRVVGIAGGREKCDWLVKEAGFDAAIDYKNENVGEALTKALPEGNRRLLRQRRRRDPRSRARAAGAMARASCCAARFRSTTTSASELRSGRRTTST